MSTKNLKRDNWTNEEVIKILNGIKICEIDENGDPILCTGPFNAGINSAIYQFQDFIRPIEQPGAMAYCPEEDMIYHIGEKPSR